MELEFLTTTALPLLGWYRKCRGKGGYGGGGGGGGGGGSFYPGSWTFGLRTLRRWFSC